MRGTSIVRVLALTALVIIVGHYFFPTQWLHVTDNGQPVHLVPFWAMLVGSALLALLLDGLLVTLLMLLLAGSSMLLLGLILLPLLAVGLIICMMLPLLLPGALLGLFVAVIVMRNKAQQRRA
ncbi:putative neutral ceramidase superfamily lipid hydrolase [Silvimonas terrae]|uniref:Putative neutral ceramidase superfamily lipid hydrolase n=1 Tax=Silvimonas terrae TaxID=300266 RepID=A0A840RMW4_9NEIS|nr:hypothetical protein [Silvimonas terrae]MBB5193431.1 putative neutral ceramidase superfamily lipid hydrolase [Silvimonas terrae]